MDFWDVAEMFPWGGHDDQIDAASLALAKLARMQILVPQPPAVLTPGKANCYAGDFAPLRGRGGATGLDGDHGFCRADQAGSTCPERKRKGWRGRGTTG